MPLNSKYDIAGRADIEKIVDAFYTRVQKDDLLGPIFNDIAKVNWETHLEKMYNFWENLLYKTGSYNGRPFPPHLAINQTVPLTKEHFNRWLVFFHDTIDQMYAGPHANHLKSVSEQLKEIWNLKFDYINSATTQI